MEHLEKEYNFSLQYIYKNTLKGLINNIFVDIITHDYPYIYPFISSQEVRMVSKQDVAAMKVNAIVGNGTRIKDFIDLYFLLKDFSFLEIISFYQKKYSNRNVFHAVKSITYFEDIISCDFPLMYKEKGLTLEVIKKELCEKRDEYLKNQ